MKKLTLATLTLLSVSSFAMGDLHCRNLDDFRRQVKIVQTSGGPVIHAIVDDYGSGSSARDSIIAKQKVSQNGTQYTGWNLVFTLYPNETPEIDYRKTDGNMDKLMLGVFSKGLRTSFHGEYACITDGYMGLTIQGDEPDGGYSISF